MVQVNLWCSTKKGVCCKCDSGHFASLVIVEYEVLQKELKVHLIVGRQCVSLCSIGGIRSQKDVAPRRTQVDWIQLRKLVLLEHLPSK